MNCNSCRKPFLLHAPNCKKPFNSGILLAESKMPEKILSILDLEVAGSKKLPTPARGEQAFSAPIRLLHGSTDGHAIDERILQLWRNKPGHRP